MTEFQIKVFSQIYMATFYTSGQFQLTVPTKREKKEQTCSYACVVNDIEVAPPGILSLLLKICKQANPGMKTNTFMT